MPESVGGAAWLSENDAELLGHLWPDAPHDADVLALYLDAAREACAAYAPTPPAAGIPSSWRIAQAYQARNIYNAGMAGAGGDLDGSGYGLTAYPLDWSVRQMLRPRTSGIVL